MKPTWGTCFVVNAAGIQKRSSYAISSATSRPALAGRVLGSSPRTN